MGIFDPQGLPSSPTTQSTTTSNINAWAQPYVMNYLNQGNNLLNQPPAAMQQQSWDQISNLQTPQQFGQGSSLLNQAGQGQLSTVNPALGYGAQGAGYGQRATGAGQAYQNMATNPNSIAAYMNPYIQQSLAPQLALLNQQQALGAQGIASKAAGQGAFGGNRATLAQGLNAQNYALAGQTAIGQGYNEAFKNAQQAQQFGSDLGLRGLQAGMQGAQVGLQGVQGAQQGYSGATQAGVGLGNIGAQQSQADIARIGLLNTMANQQYNLPFQRLNFMQGLMSGLPVSSSQTQGYQAAPNKLSQTAGALGALGSYAPAIGSAASGLWNWANGSTPVSAATQAARDASGTAGINSGNPAFDIGTGAYPTNPDGSIDYSGAGWGTGAGTDWNAILTGEDWAKGGVIKEKRYASGGIASIDRKVLNNPTDYSAQTINRGAQNNLFGDVTKLLALDTIAKQKQALQNQQAMQQQARPPVLAQLQQQAMQQQMPQGMPQQMPQGMSQQAPQQMAQAMPQGIDAARSNLPQQYAGGGIIAFDEGGTAKSEERPTSTFDRFLSSMGLNQEEARAKYLRDLEKQREFEDVTRNQPGLFAPTMQAERDKAAADLIAADAARRGNTPAPTDVKPAAPAGNNDIVIHPNPPSGPDAPAAPTAPAAPAYKPASTSGIDELVKGYENMIKGSEDFKKAESDADRSAFRKTMLGMMGGKSPYFFTNLGESGLAAQEGLDKTTEAIQTRKDKQIGQLATLGLKGAELKNEAQKLGISEAELQAKLPYYQAHANYYNAAAKTVGQKGGAGGKRINDATLYKITQEYKGYSADPKSAPFFSRLPTDVRTGLTKYPPGSTSYNNALTEFNKILQQEMQNEVGTLRSLGAGSSPSSDSLI